MPQPVYPILQAVAGGEVAPARALAELIVGGWTKNELAEILAANRADPSTKSAVTAHVRLMREQASGLALLQRALSDPLDNPSSPQADLDSAADGLARCREFFDGLACDSPEL